MQIYLRFSERKYLRPQVKGTNKREENQILFAIFRAKVPKTFKNYIRKKVYTAMAHKKHSNSGMCYTASSCIQAVTLLCMRCLKAALKVL